MVLTELLAGLVKTKMSKNKQNGFSLIEVLIVLLIAGILLSFSIYSVNLLDKQRQNSNITQLKNTVHSIQRKVQMLNFKMRMRAIVEKQKQKIIIEYFNIEKRAWLTDNTIKMISLKDENINTDVVFIEFHPNGFITDGIFCIDNECVNIAKLVQERAVVE